jgi:hypothetical protein
MSSRRWEQFAAASGIAFVVLIVVSFLLPGEAPPQFDDSVQEIQSFYAGNESALQAAAYLTGIASFFFLWFLGRLRSALARAEGEAGRLSAVAFGAGVLTLALALGSTAVGDVLAMKVARIGDPAVTRALFELQMVLITFSAFAIAALVGATSIVALQTGLLASWLAYAGELLAFAWLIGGIGVFVEHGAFSSTGAFGFVVFFAWVVWVIAVSVSLVAPNQAEGTMS